MKKRTVGIAFIALVILFGFVSFGFAKDITVGVIMSGDIPYYKSIHKAFTGELNSKGIKAEIIVQTPAPETMAWINAARKFGAIGADVIVTYGAPATIAAVSETSGIPIVFAGVYDREGLGLKSDVTGITSKASIAGLLKNLKSINSFSTLGIIYNSAEKDTVMEAAEIERLEGQFSFKSAKFNVKGRGDLSKIKNVDAIFITTSCAAMVYVDDIVNIARKQRIPAAALTGGGEEEGIVLTLSADPAEQGKAAANILARIIRGEKPSAIPVESPKKIQLTVNFKEATALGLKVPFDILSSATMVIK